MVRFFAAALLLVGSPLLPGGEPAVIKAIHLDKLNTAADETDPCVAADNLTLYFATNAQSNYDIHWSRRTQVSQPWPMGKPVTGLATKEADERSPFLFKAALFFATNALPDEKLKDLKNFDIMHRTADRAPLILPGISEADDELHPWITATGKEFYFSRKRSDGWTLFVAEGPVPGPIGKARGVGFPAGFHHATVSSGGLTMYLQGPVQGGRTGLYRSKRTKVGAEWSKPEPLTQVNHPKGPRGDVTPSLSPDGTRLFFASDRPEGKGGLDIWYISVVQLAK